MAPVFDPETLDRFRTMTARSAYDEAKDAVWRSGGATSDDFVEVYQELVDAGILDWEQIEAFERSEFTPARLGPRSI